MNKVGGSQGDTSVSNLGKWKVSGAAIDQHGKYRKKDFAKDSEVVSNTCFCGTSKSLP